MTLLQPNSPLLWLSTAIAILLATAFLRLLYILPSTNPLGPLPRNRGGPTRLLIVLGSGGHTAEMLTLLRPLRKSSYTRRSYLVSAGDTLSDQRAVEFEDSLPADDADGGRDKPTARGEGGRGYEIYPVPRARNIHQSLASTPYTALKCCFACSEVLRGNSTAEARAQYGAEPQYPDLIVCNGPGTAVCVVLVALWLRFWGVRGTDGKMRTVYVESFARVRTLSLSGRILKPCVDRFLVQWKGLEGGRAEYRGVLVQ